MQVRVEQVTLAGDAAFVTDCANDTIVIFDVVDPANPADDIVFRGEQISYRVTWTLARIDGRWLVASGETIDQRVDGDLCGF